MLNQPTPDIFQAMQRPEPQAVTAETGNDIFKPVAEGIQAMGDNLVALLDSALNKVVNFGASAFNGVTGGDVSFSTGRFEDPGFAPSAPVVAAATPMAAKGQSLEAPALAMSREAVSEAQLGNLSPNINFHKGPSQDQGIGLA